MAALLSELENHLAVLVQPVRDAIAVLLEQVQGTSFGSLEENQDVTKRIGQLLQLLNLRVACPKPECGRPATLRCAPAGNSTHGVFQFDHAVNGRRSTHLGSSRLPHLRLVPAPSDRRRAGPSS
jgi:hypothetical protein